MRHTVTTCDAPGCNETAQDELPPTWWRADVSIAHGPFPFMVDHRNEIVPSQALYACRPSHLTDAIADRFTRALDAMRSKVQP